jgi:hypothetical protein
MVSKSSLKSRIQRQIKQIDQYEHQKTGAEVVDIIYKNQPEEIITSARGEPD